MNTSKKSYLLTISVFVVLYLLTKNVPDNFFRDYVVNQKDQINSWDILHLFLGYPMSFEIGSKKTYFNMYDPILLFTPLVFQLTGVFLSVYFIKIPLSFHSLIKNKAISKKQYYLFFLKKSIKLILAYAIFLFFLMKFNVAVSQIITPISSFNSSEGDFSFILMLYCVMYFFLCFTCTLIIFLGYLNNKAILSVAGVSVGITLLNILDKTVSSINFILFDPTHYFLDSLLFWGFSLLLILGILMKKNWVQEVYND
ncbi:hypothetical protein [Vagococcus hydrophili]|uniref:Uncharacterized protein n=1 Tax=Vagococcus hydrophili TaxID=2714947 RepID=A0A6G8ATK1_9ENTE|nr:hypothetical protein [Vagococcus hydrophili]QIL48265.1 hypothetical protein G7082_07050 [Vagococcus hydrophili]